jgi:hypothetical protein
MKSPRSSILVLLLALAMPMPTDAFLAEIFQIILSIFIPNWKVRMMMCSRFINLLYRRTASAHACILTLMRAGSQFLPFVFLHSPHVMHGSLLLPSSS